MTAAALTLGIAILVVGLWFQRELTHEQEWREADAISRLAVEDRPTSPARSVVVGVEAIRLAGQHGGDTRVADQRLRKTLATFHSVVVGGFRKSNRHHAVSEDRRWLVCETEQERVALHDLDARDAPGEFAPAAYLDAPPSEVHAVEAHPEGKFVATVGEDGSAYLWRNSGAGRPWSAKSLIAPNLKTLDVAGDASAPRSWTRQIRWSPRGSWLVVYGNDPEITLFRIGPQGIDRRLTLRGHAKPVEFLRFTPDESRLITACSDLEDRVVRVWDLSAADPSESVRHLAPFKDRIRDVVLTADGRWFIAGDEHTMLCFTPAPFDGSGAVVVPGATTSSAGGLLSTRPGISSSWASPGQIAAQPSWTSRGRSSSQPSTCSTCGTSRNVPSGGRWRSRPGRASSASRSPRSRSRRAESGSRSGSRTGKPTSGIVRTCPTAVARAARRGR